VPIRVTICLHLFVAILLAHSRLFPLQLQLLIALLLDHVVGPLVQAHATLLRLDLVLDQGGEALGVRPGGSGGGRTNARHGVVLLAELLDLGVIATTTD